MIRTVALLCAVALAACAPPDDRVGVPGRDGAHKTAALARAGRRAFDGAPPVIPHDFFGMACTHCHDSHAPAVPRVLPVFAPRDGAPGKEGDHGR